MLFGREGCRALLMQTDAHTMPSAGRNDPCPCGSGKKYKRCCRERDEAALLAARAAGEAEQRARAAELQAAMAESMELDRASNAVVDLLDAGRLDDAEHAARDLLLRYPEVHDGHDRLGMVYEARGLPREAAECYRQALAFIRARPDDYEPAMQRQYLEMIAKLDPPPPG